GAQLTLNADGSLTYVPVSAAVYDDGFTYAASDGSASSTATVTIHVTDAAPVAVDDSGFATDENQPLAISSAAVLANDSDPDGDPLTVTDSGQPQHGTVSFDGSDFTYTPNADYHGPDDFTYTINDGVGGTSSATVSLTVNHVNQPPVAVDDWADTP